MGEIEQNKARQALGRIVRKTKNAPMWQAAIQAMTSAKYVDHSETKSGITTFRFSSREDGRATLKIRVPSGFIATFEGGDGRMVWRELWKSLSDQFGLHGLSADLSRAVPTIPYSQEVDLLVGRMQEEAGPFFDQLISAVRGLSTEYAGRAEADKIRGIVESLRGEIGGALSNGVSREQILRILDEETVKSVQEG